MRATEFTKRGGRYVTRDRGGREMMKKVEEESGEEKEGLLGELKGS